MSVTSIKLKHMDVKLSAKTIILNVEDKGSKTQKTMKNGNSISRSTNAIINSPVDKSSGKLFPERLQS